MWPMCIRSNTPWHCTTVLPRRLPASSVASASMSLTLLVGGTRGPLRRQELKPFFRRFSDRIRIPHRRFAPVVDVGQHDLHAVFELRLRLPAEDAADLRRVGKRAIGLDRKST